MVRSILSCLCLATGMQSSLAVTVNVYANVLPTCNYPNGTIQAVGSGGVGPYTFLWNTGATTDILTGVAPGTYSVTITDANSDQATDDIVLTGQPYALTDLGNYGPEGLCSNGITGVVVNGPGTDILETQYMGELPYTIDGQLMQEYIYYEFSNPIDTFYTWTATPAQYGTTVVYAFADGAGCTGTLTEYIGYPVEWPELNVLDTQGACSGGANGTVTFQTGLEGHGQLVQVKVEDLNNNYINSFPAGDQVYTHTATLPPGDYFLTRFMSESGFLVSSGCQLTTPFTIPDLGSTCGHISGTVFMDNNENCSWQGNEPGVPSVMLEILPGPVYTLTNGGLYGINLPMGTYTVEQQSNGTVDDHCVSAPAPFTLDVGDAFETVNIADTALVPLDASVALATGPARPGFVLNCAALMRNLTLASTGPCTMSLEFDPVLTYISANPAPTVINGNSLMWNIAAFSSFQERTLHIQFQVPPDISLLGTELLFNASITTVNPDIVPGNNSIAISTIVTGSYDPNDKRATTSSRASDELYLIDEDEWIDYTIRFQNTGTDTAFNIVVTDTIVEELDLGTFVAGASSHPHSLSVRDGRVLRWAFYNIQLPDSNVNEPRSHGFVSFRIRPRQPLVPGTPIENIANIYFDFNPPVITEPSVLTAEFSTRVEGQERDQVSLAPVPASDELIVACSDAIANVRILAADGREVLRMSARSTQVRIGLNGLKSGAYLLEAELDSRTMVRERFIKQ